MSIDVSKTAQDVLQSICRGIRAAVNLHHGDAALQDRVAAELEERLKPDVIVLDVSAYTSFEELARELILQLLLREDKPEGCRVPDTAIDELDRMLQRRHVGRLLNAYGRQNSWIGLILKRFDAAEHYWDGGDCGWVRELVDSGKIPACVVLSEAQLTEITDEPVGSSPLHNIFKHYSLAEGE